MACLLHDMLSRCSYAYGDIRCSSRRVVGIAVERPLKRVAAATWRGTAVRSVNTRIGKTIITCADNRLRPAARIIRREEALSPRAHPKIPVTPPAPLSPEWPRPLHLRILSRPSVITLWKPLPRRTSYRSTIKQFVLGSRTVRIDSPWQEFQIFRTGKVSLVGQENVQRSGKCDFSLHMIIANSLVALPFVSFEGEDRFDWRVISNSASLNIMVTCKQGIFK